MAVNPAHSDDIIFNRGGLLRFIKMIRHAIKDNYHFVSTSDMAEKRAANASYVFTGYEKEIEDAFPSSNDAVGWNKGNIAKICIINNEIDQGATLNSDANRNSGRYTWVRGGSLLKFETEISGKTKDNRPNGTIWIDENNGTTLHAVKVKGFDDNGNFDNSTAGTTSSITTDSLYADSLGSSTSYTPDAYITNLHLGGSGLSSSGDLTVTSTTQAERKPNDPNAGNEVSNISNLTGSIKTLGGIAAGKKIKGERIYAAVFNDYAECRQTIDLEPGRVIIDNDDGSLSCANQRLQPGAQVISDTYGNLIGEMYGYETPIAVSGRVLAYTYQPRENYHAGMAVCSAPNGTIDIMTREEIKEYPDCIIGIVSEIPQYEKWGTNQVNVDGRIWIKVK